MTRVLAVDDSISMRRMVAFALKGAGFHVIDAVDGLDALRKAQDQQADIVLADVHMPNMDGITLIRELRKMPQYRSTPMLLLTTDSDPERKAEGAAAGATGWMMKPCHPGQLLATLKRVLN